MLYLALEDSPRRLQERLSVLLPEGSDWSEQLHLVHQIPRLDEGFSTLIETWVKDHPDARLILVDTFARIRQIKPGNSNMYQLDYAEVAPLQKLALDNNIAIVLVHHTKKGEEPDPLALISGSFGLSGAADGALILNRVRNQPFGQLTVIGREVDEQIIDLSFEDGRWTRINLSTTLSPERQALWDALDSVVSRGPQELAHATSRPESAIKMLLKEMVHASQVRKVGRGQYLRAQPPDSAYFLTLNKNTNEIGNVEGTPKSAPLLTTPYFQNAAYP